MTDTAAPPIGLRGSVSLIDAYRRVLAPDVHFDSGTKVIDGRDVLLSYIARSVDEYGVAMIRVDVRHAAAAGDVVLVERVDHLCAPDGSELCALPVAGSFTLRDGRVTRWCDFYDTARLSALPR